MVKKKKYTNQELKAIEDALYDTNPELTLDEMNDEQIQFFIKAYGLQNIRGKLPKYIHRHQGGKYQIQKYDDGTYLNFGVYSTLEEAEEMKEFLMKKEFDKKYCIATLRKNGKKLRGEAYTNYLKELKDKGKSMTDPTPSLPNLKSQLKNKHKVLKSLTLPRSTDTQLKNLHKKYGLTQGNIVQVAVSIMANMSSDAVEHELIKRGMY